MTTEVRDPQKKLGNGTVTRIVGTIQKEPEQKTSGKGNVYLAFPVLIDDGAGTKTWWNCKVMEALALECPKELFAKFRYAKFSGLGETRQWSKDGRSGTSHDLLVTGIEMQDGSFIRAPKREQGEEG